MGPLEQLIKFGATVVAIARPNSRSDDKKWSKLLSNVKGHPGTIIFPRSAAEVQLGGKITNEMIDSLSNCAGADVTT